MERLGKKDKAVIRAFTEQRRAEGTKLDSTGTRLSIMAFGGIDIAVWKNGKIHFPGTHGSRSGQLIERAVAREAPKNDLFNGRGYNPKKRSSKKQYRAIRWYHDDMKPVGEWRNTRAQALRDYFDDFDPHSRVAIWEIETSTGERLDITEDEYQQARSGYAESVRASHERGVWGNPKRRKNTHDARRSASEFRSAVIRAGDAAYTAAKRGDKGDVPGMLNSVIEAAYWVGRASAEQKYATDVDPEQSADFRALSQGYKQWGDGVYQYMRDVMGVAANPAGRKKNVSTSTAACTVGASAHKTRSAAARQCGAKWKASKEKFASTGGKAAARSSKSPIGKRGRRRKGRS